MRIIIITSSSNRSGGTRQAMYQAQALAERGHEVFFCVPAQGGLWEVHEPSENPKWIALESGREKEIVESLLSNDSCPTIVHAFHNRAVKRVAWWGLCWQVQNWWNKLLGKPTRNVACVSHRGVIYRPGNPFPYLSPGLQKVLVNSKACGEKLNCHCPAHKIEHVPNGVPVSRVTPSLSPQDSQALYGIISGSPLFIHVGANNRAKGMDTLLAAFALASLPEARLLVIGPNPVQWQPICDQLGLTAQVQFLGRVENVADCLQLAGAFIFASRDMDSAPNTLLEAMHLGLPVIATTVGGVPEIAQGNGILVPPDNPQALSVALQKMAADPVWRQKLGAKSLILAQNYTMQKRCESLEKIYEDLLKP